MSAEKYPTLSLVAPSIQALSTSLDHSATDTDVIKEIKTFMKYDLSTRYQQRDIKTMILCASFLDPQLRTLDFISCSYPNMNENEQKKWIEAEKKRVKTEMKQRVVALDSKPQGYIKSEPSDMPQVNAPAINPSP